MSDSLQALADAGIPTDSIPEEQRAVLADLSEDEVKVLVSIHKRMQSDVQGYAFQPVSPQLGGLNLPGAGGANLGAAKFGGSGLAGGLNPRAIDDTGGLFF